MRYTIILIAYFFCTSTFAGSIKEAAVPAKVKNYVINHYPKARSIDWDFEDDDNLYEAKFKIDQLKYKLQITPDGRLYTSKEDVLISTLPKAIPQYIREHYAGYKILGANKKISGNKVTYDVGIKGKNAQGHTRHYNIYFDSKGNKISRK